MTKNQKLEWVLSGLLMISFLVCLYVAIDNLDLFGTKKVSTGVVISVVALFVIGGVFLINYLIKTILAFTRKTDGKLVPLMWILAPAACAVITIFFANGMWTFNQEFVVFNILSVVFGVLEILIINLYFAVFYGRNKVMAFSLIIYNALVWGKVLLDGVDRNIKFVHNYYIAFFVCAVFIGYIELAIRNKIRENK